MERPLTLAADVSELAGRVEASVRRLGELPGSRGPEEIARFLLRSEARASSRIEGLQVCRQQVGSRQSSIYALSAWGVWTSARR